MEVGTDGLHLHFTDRKRTPGSMKRMAHRHADPLETHSGLHDWVQFLDIVTMERDTKGKNKPMVHLRSESSFLACGTTRTQKMIPATGPVTCAMCRKLLAAGVSI